MAKKQTFTDKTKKKGKDALEWVKVVKAVKQENGAWKFRTQMVALTDDNRKELYG